MKMSMRCYLSSRQCCVHVVSIVSVSAAVLFARDALSNEENLDVKKNNTSNSTLLQNNHQGTQHGLIAATKATPSHPNYYLSWKKSSFSCNSHGRCCLAPFSVLEPFTVQCAQEHSTKKPNIVQTSTTAATSTKIPSPSRLRRFLARIHMASLPLPRVLQKGDAVFQNSFTRQKLKQRQRDEVALRGLAAKARLVNNNDKEKMQALFLEMCEIAHGKHVTPQERENFMIQYGCTGYTTQILDSLVHLAQDCGIIEMGAGHGQWARAIAEHYRKTQPKTKKPFDFILAFDDMTELPLSTDIYHDHTQPARDYFYNKVQTCTNLQTTLQQWQCRGRVLLLVYPPPGSMALTTIETFAKTSPEQNNVVVYVGEGRGGANGNEALFDYLESGEWILLQTLPVRPSPGNKGFEQYHVFQKRTKQ